MQPDLLLPLGGEFVVVVVVDEQRVRVGGVRELERLGDEVLAARLGPAGRAKVIVAVVERLVDHVPRRDAPAVALHHRLDVPPHALQQQLPAGGLVPVAEEPRRRAVVLGPDQAVADDLQAVGVGEVDEGVRLRRSPTPPRPPEPAPASCNSPASRRRTAPAEAGGRLTPAMRSLTPTPMSNSPAQAPLSVTGCGGPPTCAASRRRSMPHNELTQHHAIGRSVPMAGIRAGGLTPSGPGFFVGLASASGMPRVHSRAITRNSTAPSSPDVPAPAHWPAAPCQITS